MKRLILFCLVVCATVVFFNEGIAAMARPGVVQNHENQDKVKHSIVQQKVQPKKSQGETQDQECLVDMDCPIGWSCIANVCIPAQ